ncbi:MAG: flagellar export protein FliJ [Spirochaetales bacterium]|nr:flagellar export protein FliJ [Spirochaetales bacterium]
MRRFRFKLDKILELRRYAEQEWELKLAEVTGRVVTAEQEIAEWARRRHDTRRLHAGAGTVDMLIMRTREDYVNRIDLRVMELQHQLVALEVERSKIRDGYVEASRKRKALTRLKERQAQEYYRDALRDEGRVLDEIAGNQLIRSRLETEEIDV